MILRRRLTLIGVLGALVAVSGCGGSHARSRATTSTPAAESEATVRTANCMLWNIVDTAERRRLVAGLHAFFSQRLDSGARERLPPNARAYEAIARYCRLPFARAFLLYRLYGNASAFSTP